MDEYHSKLDASPSMQEVWQCSPAKQCALHIAKTTNNAMQKVAHATKRHKDKKTRRKIREESSLQWEAITKSDEVEEDA